MKSPLSYQKKTSAVSSHFIYASIPSLCFEACELVSEKKIQAKKNHALYHFNAILVAGHHFKLLMPFLFYNLQIFICKYFSL